MTDHETDSPADEPEVVSIDTESPPDPAGEDVANAAAEPGVREEPVIVRRSRRAPFAPPRPEGEGSSGAVVSRNWALGLRSAQARNTGLTRNRTIAGELPAWAPLPPGELAVRRGGAHL